MRLVRMLPTLLLPAFLALPAGLLSGAQAAEPRGGVVLRWTAPAVMGESAVAYDIRMSLNAPGSDLDAWWSQAVSQANAPVPSAPGWVDTWSAPLEPGTSAWVGIRAVDSQGQWSSLQGVHAIHAPGEPFVESVSPRVVYDEALNQFTLTGSELDQVTSVRFRGEGWTVDGANMYAVDGGTLRVSAALPPGFGEASLLLSSPQGNVVVAGWIRDTHADFPPNAVFDLSGAALDYEQVQLTWSAPADDHPSPGLQVTHYELRMLPGLGDWEGGEGIPTLSPLPPGSTEMLSVSGLVPGSTVFFALRSQDSSGNWSALSNQVSVTLPHIPSLGVVPPVEDLSVIPDTSGTAVTLRWTSPQNHQLASLYEVRSFQENETWEQGDMVAQGRPAPSGELETLEVETLTQGMLVSYAVRTLSTQEIWSEMSNRPSAVLPGDETAPAPGQSLGGSFVDVDRVRVTWINPSDPDLARYEIRRTREGSTTGGFGNAQLLARGRVGGPGQPWEVTLQGSDLLEPARWTVAFRDHTGNLSSPSNGWLVQGNEVDVVPPQLPQALRIAHINPRFIQLQWTAGGDDKLAGEAEHYDFTMVPSPNRAAAWWLEGEVTPLSQVPRASGLTETYKVRGLVHEGVYGFALSAVDEAGNRSNWISQVLSFETDLDVRGVESQVERKGTGWEIVIPRTAPETEQIPQARIYDVQGRVVDGFVLRPEGSVWRGVWNGQGADRQALAAGMYFLRISLGEQAFTRKLVLRP